METLLTEEELAQSRALAELQFTPAEIALMMGFNSKTYVSLCKMPDTPEFNHYHGGRLQAEMKLRKSVYDLAIQGSSPAQTLMKKFLEERSAKYLDK